MQTVTGAKEITCPHCGVHGQVSAHQSEQKVGFRKVLATKARCGNCKQQWTY